jgi:DNA-binding MarR family transcriptional regulator/N-acetylglutamate synthase-like GNAT family acetyltransferase
MEQQTDECINRVRRFNRSYTQRIGALQEGLLDSPFSLTEVRILYELANRKKVTASELARELGLDSGYLSRILRSFQKRGFISKKRSESDARQSHLSLTKKGHQTFAPLETRSKKEVGAMLQKLSVGDQSRLVGAMKTIDRLLSGSTDSTSHILLRFAQSGDFGWIIHRHGALYRQEYGWNEEFEGLVAEIVGKFIRKYDEKSERCWVAERDGEIIGSVMLVRRSETVGQLRLLLVEPSARGLGVGKRLVEECIRFARHVGYRKVTLWTNDVLHAARHIYEEAGFLLVKEEKQSRFGAELTTQIWDLKL